MNTFTVVQDADGKALRVEFNGVVLPVDSFQIDHAIWPQKAIVQLTMSVEQVVFVQGETEGTVVDADPAHRLIEAPKSETGQ